MRSIRVEQVGSYDECLSLAEPQSEKFLKKLIGRNDIKAALSKLDKLTQEEARMATTQVLKVTSSVDEKVVSVNERVKVIDDRIAEIIDGSQTLAHIVDQAKRSSSHNLIRPSLDGGDSSIIAGNQLHENLRKWLSPPDPSTNHNTACGAHLKGSSSAVQLTPSDVLLSSSRLWEECTLVRRILLT